MGWRYISIGECCIEAAAAELRDVRGYPSPGLGTGVSISFNPFVDGDW
jgi:hypothetical protein